MFSSCGHIKSGLKEVPLQNSNFVPIKGDVEYFDKILLKRKRKGVESDFSGSHNFYLRYRIGER
jgi:hypothetical protein